MRKIFIYLLAILFFLSFINYVGASSHLPPAIIAGQQYEKESAKQFLGSLSFLIAFLAGLLAILSPCSYVSIPAFFSYTFKEKKEITKMTFIFFLGFTTIFVLLGLIAAKLGNTLAQFQYENSNLALIAGIFLVLFGLLTILGKGFSFLKLNKKFKHDVSGIYLYGIFFGLGWNVCAGPILAGILTIASVLGNYIKAGLLMFAYSIGVFVPLFLLSFFWDKYNFTNSKLLRGKEFKIGNFGVHSTNLIAGILIIAAGALMILYRGTYIINAFDFLKTTEYFYSLQRNLTKNLLLYNIIGFIVLLVLIILIVRFLRRKKTLG